MSADDQLRAAYMVLGLLQPEEEAAARQEAIDDPSFGALAASWAERLDSADPATDAPAPDGLWDRISDRIDDTISAPQTQTLRREDGVWETLAPGLQRKVVHADRAAGTVSYLVRMRAGAILPVHIHERDEQCVIVEGQLQIGDRSFSAGDFHLAHAGGEHVPIKAVTDSLFFIHGAL